MDQPVGLIVDAQTPGLVKVQGELDAQSAEQLLAALAGTDGQSFDIDLSGVTFIDSSGLRAMIRIRRHHKGAGFVRPSALVSRLVDMTGMAKILGLDPTTSQED